MRFDISQRRWRFYETFYLHIRTQLRQVSTSSAINRGLRGEQLKPNFPSRKPGSVRKGEHRVQNHGRYRTANGRSDSGTQSSRTPLADSKAQQSYRQPVKHVSMSQKRLGEPLHDRDEHVPVSVPYTKAASVFLYGYNTVLAALKARRRKLYKVYLHQNPASRAGAGMGLISSLARTAGVKVYDEGLNVKVLDRMSDGRPNNGIILEASRLPAPPVLGLGRPNAQSGDVPLLLDRQSAEESEINHTPAAISSLTGTWRQPFVVLLDGITDPGNVGNIIRTAHFYGVDAIAIATNTCANLASAVLAKASSGACEAMQILALPKPSNFVYHSAKSGWQIFAAVSPQNDSASVGSTSGRSRSASNSSATPQLRRYRSRSHNLTTYEVSRSSPLAERPCILLLGAEGEGLRENLRNRADRFVSITRGEVAANVNDVGVDSVNVSVAAGVLMESFLRKPEDAKIRAGSAVGDLGF